MTNIKSAIKSAKKLTLKSTCIALIVICVIILFIRNPKIDSVQHTSTVSIKAETIPPEKAVYIFDWTKWHLMLVMKQNIDNIPMCDIPSSVQPISNAYCNINRGQPCPQIPCPLVHKASSPVEHVKCHKGGRLINTKDEKQTNLDKDQYIECLKSPALELFEHGPPYPSVITNGYDRITKEFFGDILSRSYRSPGSVWALTHLGESITTYPWCGKKSIISLFDFTMGYDRQLYHVASNEYLPWDLHYLTQGRAPSFSVILDKKQPPSYVTAPIFWMNANCFTPTNRTEYIRDIMQYIPVDSWGACGRNKGPELPPDIARLQEKPGTSNHLDKNWQEIKKALMKNYLFTVAIENSLDHDYVTEKLWQVLAAGSVPLYYGAPNVAEWLPCDDCIIDLSKFATIRDAAAFILSVANNATRYAEFHRWRNEPVPARFLKVAEYFDRTRLYSVDCIVCGMAHTNNPQVALSEILHDIGPVFGSTA